jgi:hypothetical protein
MRGMISLLIVASPIPIHIPMPASKPRRSELHPEAKNDLYFPIILQQPSSTKTSDFVTALPLSSCMCLP